MEIILKIVRKFIKFQSKNGTRDCAWAKELVWEITKNEYIAVDASTDDAFQGKVSDDRQ